jgi:acylphosphatase
LAGSNAGSAGTGPRAVHWLIAGRVQGVGFRYFVRETARRNGVRGDVRNLPDGRVEMRASGDDLGPFLREVRRGPVGSRVDDVESLPPDSALEFDGFEIRF